MKGGDRITKDSDNEQAGAASISLFITRAQKAKLRERGFADEQIRNMLPAEAHHILGLDSADASKVRRTGKPTSVSQS